MKAALFPTSTTRDGRTFIGHETAGGGGWDVWTFADGQITPLISTAHNEVFGVVSAGGRWIAWMSDESGPFDVYVASYPDLCEKQRIGTRRRTTFMARGWTRAVFPWRWKSDGRAG